MTEKEYIATYNDIEYIRVDFENIKKYFEILDSGIINEKLISEINKEINPDEKMEISTLEDIQKYTCSEIKKENNILFPIMMQYRMTLLFIELISQLWEQHLILVFKDYLPDPNTNEGYSFDFLKKNLKDLGYDIEDENIFLSFTKLNEMRNIVNVIKHGDGRSKQKLDRDGKGKTKYESGANFFKLYKTPLVTGVMNIHAKEFYGYCDEIIQFWNELENEMKRNGDLQDIEKMKESPLNDKILRNIKKRHKEFNKNFKSTKND